MRPGASSTRRRRVPSLRWLAAGALVVALALPARAGEPAPLASIPGHEGSTPCGRCHTPEGWRKVTFDHERTGFPLTGAHRQASCQGCHRGELSAPVPRTCGACHRDPHRGELGQRCEGCHDTSTWASAFDADAHRRTAFPLTGKHAFIPCEECHAGSAGGSFSGTAATCERCHEDDYLRTGARGIDHRQAGFSRQCQQCHDPWSFRRGRWPGHDACFGISTGPHAGIECQRCHSSLAGKTITGTCSTNTAACTGCHEHGEGETVSQHRGVSGFQYKDRKCYECHRFSSGPLKRLLRRLR